MADAQWQLAGTSGNQTLCSWPREGQGSGYDPFFKHTALLTAPTTLRGRPCLPRFGGPLAAAWLAIKNCLQQDPAKIIQSCVISHSWNMLLKLLLSLETSWNALKTSCYLLKLLKCAWNSWNPWNSSNARHAIIKCKTPFNSILKLERRPMLFKLLKRSWNSCHLLKPLEMCLKWVDVSWNSWNAPETLETRPACMTQFTGPCR